MFSRETILNETNKLIAVFTKNLNPKEFPPAQQIIDFLTVVKEIKEADASINIINFDLYRHQFQSCLTDDKIYKTKKNGVKLSEIIYYALLNITAIKPINETDPFTQDKINPQDKTRVLTSDGYQFDGESLAHWIRNKNGDMINPCTRAIFSQADQEAIKKFAQQNNFSLTPIRRAHDEEDADLLAGILDAIRQEDAEQNEPIVPIILSLRITHSHPFFFEARNQTNSAWLNFWQQSALNSLRAYGLTADMLRHRNDNGHVFDEHHCHALRNLIMDRHASLHDALAIIDGLSSAQAGGIEEGLSRADVINLHNFWHIAALEALKTHGLTADMLQHRNDNGHVFNEHHCFALRNLIMNRHASVHDALAIIDGLSSEEAREIEKQAAAIRRTMGLNG